MFDDVDDTLREVLIADVPIKTSEVEIAFDRPTREWAGRLSKPTLNLFLYDIREREGLKDDVPAVTRDPNGRAVKQRPPRRIDLAYMVTAWTKEPADEHRILAGVLACMYRQGRVAAEHLQGDLKSSAYPVLTRVSPPEELVKPNDLWGALNNDMRASLFWVWTVPLDVFKPVVGPLVRTRELRVGLPGQPPDAVLVEVGGLVHRRGDPLAGVAGVKVSVVGTGFEAETDAEGQFRLSLVPPGEHLWRIQAPGLEAKERKVVVPSDKYDIEIG